MSNKRGLALVSCSAKKLTVPAPAKYLYSASPRFSMIYMAALRECKQVVIVSGEHGILNPERWVAPYEHLILDDSALQQRLWARRCAKQLRAMGESDICSYLSKGYAEVLRTAVRFEQITHGDMFAVAKQLGSTKTEYDPVLRENPWPLPWVMELVYSRGIAVRDLRSELSKRKFKAREAEIQVRRALQCPLHRLKGALITSRAHENEVLEPN